MSFREEIAKIVNEKVYFSESDIAALKSDINYAIAKATFDSIKNSILYEVKNSSSRSISGFVPISSNLFHVIRDGEIDSNIEIKKIEDGNWYRCKFYCEKPISNAEELKSKGITYYDNISSYRTHHNRWIGFDFSLYTKIEEQKSMFGITKKKIVISDIIKNITSIVTDLAKEDDIKINVGTWVERFLYEDSDCIDYSAPEFVSEGIYKSRDRIDYTYYLKYEFVY